MTCAEATWGVLENILAGVAYANILECVFAKTRWPKCFYGPSDGMDTESSCCLGGESTTENERSSGREVQRYGSSWREREEKTAFLACVRVMLKRNLNLKRRPTKGQRKMTRHFYFVKKEIGPRISHVFYIMFP